MLADFETVAIPTARGFPAWPSLTQRVIMRYTFVILFLSLAAPLSAAETVLVRDGKSVCAIFVPPRVLDDAVKNPEPASNWRTPNLEDQRRRLRESVRDLAGILERISGAKIDIVAARPREDKRIAFLIGEYATEKFGAPDKKYPFQQGIRVAVTESAIGLAGESDLATSYAVYTFLHDLG